MLEPFFGGSQGAVWGAVRGELGLDEWFSPFVDARRSRHIHRSGATPERWRARWCTPAPQCGGNGPVLDGELLPAKYDQPRPRAGARKPTPPKHHRRPLHTSILISSVMLQSRELLPELERPGEQPLERAVEAIGCRIVR